MPKNPNNVNQEAFRGVADAIEWADRFDLTTWAIDTNSLLDSYKVIPSVWDNCGTLACVAGWVCAWADRVPTVSTGVADVGQEELGITDDQANRLFYNGGVWAEQAERFGWTTSRYEGEFVTPATQITAAQAAIVLREIASGKITL